MKLVLPRMVQLGWCERHAGVLPWVTDGTCQEVTVGAIEPVSYVDPLALAILAAWSRRLHDSSVRVIIDDSLKSPYAWRCGLLSALAGRFDQAQLSSERFLRRHVQDEEHIEHALSGIRLVCQGAGRNPGIADGLVYFLAEILRNVFEHSESPEGAFVCGGYFPNAGRTTVAIVDMGVTVPKHVQRRWKQKVDKSVALRVALEPRTSGSTDDKRNAGLGLYMTRRIATLMGGSFLLMSDSLVAKERSNQRGGYSEAGIQDVEGSWPGTAVAVSLITDSDTSFAESERMVHLELSGRPTLDIFRKRAEPAETCISISPDIRTIAQDKLYAAGIRDSILIPSVTTKSDSICLDMSHISLTTQSYIHALLAEPIRLMGIDEVQRRLRVIGACPQVKQVIKIVLQYTLD